MTSILQYIPFHRCCRVLLLVFTCVLFCFSSRAQTSPESIPEEVSVMLNVSRIGSMEVNAFVKGPNVFLSAKEVFDFLKIKNTLSPDVSTISGSFLEPGTAFTISKDRNTITFRGKTTRLAQGSLISTETGLYLQCNYFAVFGLDCEFNFRGLLVTLHAKVELPAIREMQQELIRRNLSRLKGERKADVHIGQRFPLFKLGMADWNVIYNNMTNGNKDLRLSAAVGAMVAGGELNANINHITGKPFDERMLLYRWRHVNNNRAWLRQVSAGKIFANATSTLLAPLMGIQLNNTPTTYRRSFGTYVLSNKTEPGWMVELYVNNILVNYTRADASGFFTFEVPMVYGTSNVKLRFYGPWGEEQTREENVVIPISFMPAGQLEYNLTAGVVSDSTRDRFARASIKYGVNRSLTIGGGMEYFTAVTERRNMPYIDASMRLFSNVILHGEYTYGVRSKGVLTYRHPSNLQIDINYIKYKEGQTAVKFMEEKRAVLSMPLRTKKYSGFTRLTFTQFNDLKKEPGTSAELLVSSFFGGISSNFTTFAILTEPKKPLIWSNLSMTFRLPAKMRLTQQTHYNYREQRVSMVRTDLEKMVWGAGYLNFVFEKNFSARTTSVGIGLRLNLSFAQTSVFAMKTNNAVTFSQSARGSFLYDDNSNKLSAFSQSNVTRAGLTIVPFLDINNNGIKEENEPKVCGLKLSVTGGRLTHCTKDTTIQIAGLEPYADYLLDIDRNSFDNIAWQVKNPTMSVVAEPNYFKRVDVPVSIVGEVAGTVVMENASGRNGLGRVLVRITKNGKQVAKVMTQPDGYFNYIGLVPGKYVAEVDEAQLENLQLTASPAKVPFTITAKMEGDFVEGVEFTVRKKDKLK